MRAHILLKADSHGGWTDAQIADAFGCHEQTAYNVRKRFAVRGRLSTLERKPQSRPSHVRKLDGQGEARLIALACSDPEGFSQWTLQLLADRAGIVESISIETVAVKKNALQSIRWAYWVIPPDNAEFVAAMERVLEVYQRPEDPLKQIG